MRRLRILLAAGMLLALVPVTAEAGVSVNFIGAERYRDADFRSASRRAGIIAEFDRYFASLGRRYLAPGQDLTIDVLRVDLAGEYEPWRFGLQDVRVMRDITPPSFRLRYTLRQGRKIIQRGEETVTDLSYLNNSRSVSNIGRFPYEKELLRDWFHRRFVLMQPGRG